MSHASLVTTGYGGLPPGASGGGPLTGSSGYPTGSGTAPYPGSGMSRTGAPGAPPQPDASRGAPHPVGPANVAGTAGVAGRAQTLTDTDVALFAGYAARIEACIGAVFLGKPDVIRLALTGLLAGGHLLIEDVPGVGKTTLARLIAASVQGVWRRIQFTPDLLPADVTGVTVYNQSSGGFEFHPGPVFANIVIADEINRASPKTQSALLEVMQEGYVTVDGVRHPVPRPFLVVATQNPVEMDGTYRLPEAQLDRFLMKLSVGYPQETVEIDVLKDAAFGTGPDNVVPVVDTAVIAAMTDMARRAYLADPLYRYAVQLAAATRTHPHVRVGVSPRGVIALTRASGARAVITGRAYAVPEDLKALALPVFAHRLLLTPEARVRGVTAVDVVTEVLDRTPVPVPSAGAT